MGLLIFVLVFSCVLFRFLYYLNTSTKGINKIAFYHSTMDVNEQQIELNGSPITIRITIEVIPQKTEQQTVVKDNILPEDPVVEVLSVPMEKKKRTYNKKVKDAAVEVEVPVVVNTPIANTSAVVVNESDVKPTPNPVATTTDNKIARVAKMIRFYCKAQGLKASDITIIHLKEKAFDIIENVSDADVEVAIKEAMKAM
jgi:hypothetical protein